jgi:hypothetical protein
LIAQSYSGKFLKFMQRNPKGLRVDELLQFFSYVGWVIRLFNEEGLCRQAVLSSFNTARRDNYFHWRPPSTNVMSERQPVHPSRHVYVCKHQSDFFMKFERADRSCGVVRLKYRKALSFEEGRCIHPDDRVILYDKNRNALASSLCHRIATRL